MKKITINLSFYNQEEILKRHILGWKTWPDKILQHYAFCIVDDCSKNSAKDVLNDIDLSNLDMSIYRVKKDLFCNISGVRNLSAKECKTDWMVILDMDTLISKELAGSMLSLCSSPPGNCFKFNRKVPRNPFHKKNNQPHPSVCMIRVKDYWDVGGCEEDLVGNYGQTDPIFWYRAQDKLKVYIRKDLYLEYIPKGQAKINRDKKNNLKLFEQKRIDNSWSKDFIRFEWEKIY
tara:strand:+ start:182 stop:880 length:699 start_codon:yes stop_codon:yes gene_type:complete